MLANMAHDLRTPLTVLLGQLEIARLRGEESETLRRVQAKAEEVLALSEAFFTLSKLEAGDTKLPCAAVDLSELCRAAALEYYDFLTQQRFEVEIHVPEEACPVWGHEESIPPHFIQPDFQCRALRCGGTLFGHCAGSSRRTAPVCACRTGDRALPRRR